MATKPKPEPSVEDKVVPISSIAIPDQNLGRWKNARLAPIWLVNSIRELGLLQPPVVRPSGFPLDPPNKDYVLVIGEKRFLAARELGVSVLRVSVRTFESPERAHAAAIAENVDRVDLSLHDEMQVVVRYAKTTRRDVQQVAKDLRMTRKQVATYLTAHSQMAPALMVDFAAIQSRNHGLLFLAAAVQTKDHAEQAGIIFQRGPSRPRKRPFQEIRSAIEMVRSAEVVVLRSAPSLQRTFAAHMDPKTPLSPRERDLVALALEWTVPSSVARRPGEPVALLPVERATRALMQTRAAQARAKKSDPVTLDPAIFAAKKE
jgi:ParB/RepB/Spo0J family partition protein